MQTQCPALPLFPISVIHNTANPIVYDKCVVNSESGIKKDDPIGPLLFFSVALDRYIENQELLPKFQQHSWCLDDSVLVDSEDNLIRSWNLPCTLRPDHGLHVEVDMCELWSTAELERLDIAKKSKS